MYSKLRIFGHPIHPMIIPYPIASYTGTFAAFVVYAITGDLFWLRAAIVLNIAGVATALVAALPGFIDWLVGIPTGTPAKRTGLIHMVLNVAALAVFAVNLAIYAGDWNDPNASSALGIVLSVIGILLTIAAGFQGWSLIQDHHVGVNLTPEQQRLDDERERAAARS